MLKTMTDDGLCVKVYDPETKKVIGVFDTFTRTGSRLGIDGRIIHQKATSKKRVYSPALKKHVAIRVASLGETEKLLIKETAKYKAL